MVRLASAVKEAFDLAGIPIFQFYGAGAAGSAFLTQIHAKRCIDRFQPPEVERAGRHGYVGGRIEVPTYGEIPGPIYRYDLNSAHPSVIANLPNLKAGSWSQDRQLRRDLPFSIYHVSWKFSTDRRFYPFPWRSPEGAIFFPPIGRAWIWQPELVAALEAGSFPKRSIRILDAWHFMPEDPIDRPFKVVEEKYAIRKSLEAEGKAAARAIKLCLNSIYGKFAQSVSAAGKFGAERGHARKPTYHQIEYAGYICSAVRASVYPAACQKPAAILSFATDAVLSREPLDLPTSERLGEWSAEEFQRATIVQSGVYRLQAPDGKWETHGRGFADKNLPWGRIRQGWIHGTRKLNVTGRRRRFIGLGAAKQWDDWDHWRRFETHTPGGPACGRRKAHRPAPASHLDSGRQPRDPTPRDRGLRPGHLRGLRSRVDPLEAEMGGPEAHGRWRTGNSPLRGQPPTHAMKTPRSTELSLSVPPEYPWVR